ncbi:MAG: UDP-N-acetylglucosamine--N-acetylmuramyl-(pentapeptide) pyrophosphoryl-undecaprenol N-acetylglucosamine transferase [Candidatus Daviesbacteria bacterium]|nr:UDP-N-acetylglucosamine--N-acetylmuramyl-(pentapeptide) pyrophosphoryl-undecaprenol N-acetylglucosamine transferase [Candidatus Daviesbacteria bacterium]
MKILLTGSHFTPAQAVIEKLQATANLEIVYIGRKTTREGDGSPSLESQILPQMGVKFRPIIAGRLQRNFGLYTIPSLLKVPVGFIQSFYILIKEKPDVILSFGGYVGVPVVISAWLLSIPIIIHEQTLVPSLATKISSLFADKIAVSFPGLTQDKVVVTGNPLRSEILDVNPDDSKIDPEILRIVNNAKKDKRPLVLITGGNQGSHIINETIHEIIEDLTSRFSIIHQTGDSKFNDFEKLVDIKKTFKNSNHYLVRKFFTAGELAYIYKNCDLGVSRAGINTLQELAFFGVPSLVIPLEAVGGNEQTKNAKYFQELGLVQVLPQSNLKASTLKSYLEEMVSKLETLKKEARRSRQVVFPDAASKLALETLLLKEVE